MPLLVYNGQMDTAALLSFVQESIFVIATFGAFLAYALIRGRQSITNVILGLYFALLISLKFPYYDQILEHVFSTRSEAIVMIAMFAAFAVVATLLFSRLLPREYDESTFEGFGKKLMLAVAGTILVMAYSYHALPITELVDPGSPIQSLFAPEQWFFVWLIAPLVLLFLV